MQQKILFEDAWIESVKVTTNHKLHVRTQKVHDLGQRWKTRLSCAFFHFAASELELGWQIHCQEFKTLSAFSHVEEPFIKNTQHEEDIANSVYFNYGLIINTQFFQTHFHLLFICALVHVEPFDDSLTPEIIRLFLRLSLSFNSSKIEVDIVTISSLNIFISSPTGHSFRASLLRPSKVSK